MKLKGLSDALIEGNVRQCLDYTNHLLVEGVNPMEIINQGLLPGMAVVGERFKAGQVYLPEVLMSARVMSEAMTVLRPLLTGGELPSQGKVMLGTVKGDLHNIGKNLVGILLESSGFQVIDMGTDVDSNKFLQAVREHHPDILGLSALLTTTMPRMKEMIELLKREGLNEKVKVIVGGAPVTSSFADEIGADGFASDAASATDLAKRLVHKAV